MIKPFDLSLVVGRFQHIHIGHEHIINTALSMSDRVLILLGSAQEFGTVRNPFSVVTRNNMIRAIYPDNKIVIIGTLDDKDSTPIITPAWGKHVLETTRQFVRKIPEVFLYGNEDNNTNWFQCDVNLKILTRSMSEVIVSRERYDISGTQMREYLFRDEFDKWMQFCNPKLHKHYDELRSELLNAEGLKSNVAKYIHSREQWTDKPTLRSGVIS